MFKKVMVYETDDLSIFKLFPFNRDIDKKHVNLLADNMKKHGFIGVAQIVLIKQKGKSVYYIADGQHRIAAARQLGIPVRFELTEISGNREVANFIASLNTSSKAWGTKNFLKVWVKNNIPEYVKLNKVQENTGFQITPLLEAYLFTSSQKDYREGTMTFPNEQQSDRIIQQMVDLNQYLPSKAFCRRAIVKVMLNEKYNHKKMVSAIKQYVKLVGSFTENERGLKAELDNLVAKNC